MIKRLDSRFKYLRIYLSDFKGSLFLKKKTNLKFMKYLLEKRRLRHEKNRSYKLKNVIRLKLTKSKRIPGKWGTGWGKKGYRKLVFVNKQAFRHFYATLKEKQIKRYLNYARTSRESFWKLFFFNVELRVDVLLFRLNLFVDLESVRNWFKEGNHILINAMPVYNKSYRLKLGDILEIPYVYKKEFLITLLQRVRRFFRRNGRGKTTSIVSNVPPYIEVNYKILSFIIRKIPTMKTYFTMGKFDLSVALSYYRF